jgi:hypothetical protein
MGNVHIGWLTPFVGEQLAAPELSVGVTVERPRELVEALNKVEKSRGSSDEWFVMTGNETCAKRCTLCDDRWLHHWDYEAPEDEEAEIGRMECRHCDAWRDVLEIDEDESEI